MSNSLFLLCFMILCLVKIHWPAIRCCLEAMAFIVLAMLDDLIFPTGEELFH